MEKRLKLKGNVKEFMISVVLGIEFFLIISSVFGA